MNILRAHIFVLTLIFLAGIPAFVLAAETFVPLSDLPGAFTDRDANLGTFFNTLFRYGTIAAGFLAVLALVIAGFIYMTSHSESGKSDAKDRITAALSGLFLILLSGLLLSVINPDILNFNLFRVPVQSLILPLSPSPTTTPFPVTLETSIRTYKVDSDRVANVYVYGTNSEEYRDMRYIFRVVPKGGILTKEVQKGIEEKARHDCASYGFNFEIVLTPFKDLRCQLTEPQVL